MSSKKDKFLDSAQKFIAKGQIDRAIRNYEQVVALDPNDIRHRQKLAELLVRANRNLEAIGEYEAIGKYYADNGFYLKAIAVYKQIQKLDAEDIKSNLNLAQLNEKQGLTGNALAEYGRVYSFFEKSGKRADALKILESMMSLDPENLATRIKFAETRLALGMKDLAYEDFSQVALLLKKRGDEDAFRQVSDRIRHLFPAKKDFDLEILSSRINSGDAVAAINDLQEITKRDQGNLNAWQLLLDAYSMTEALEERRTALQNMERIFPDNLSVKEGLMQYALDDGDLECGLSLLELNRTVFAEKGDVATPERIYRGLLDHAPHDVRLLLGLQQLYESAGDQVKMAEMAERIDSLTRLGLGTSAERGAEPSFPGGEAIPLECREATLDGPGELSIDFSDVGSGADFDAIKELDSGEPEPDISGNIDLELDISGDDLAHLAEFTSEAESGARMSQKAAVVPVEEPVPNHAREPAVEVPAITGEALFDSAELESIELDIDIFPETDAKKNAAGQGQDRYSPDELFSAFKKGLDQQLDKGDTETRYNLGIAFKEMGLYDEAVAEFRAAAADPQRKADCITLQGVCYRDKGDAASAEEMFSIGIELPGLSLEERLSIRYEMALLYESIGRTDDAIHVYRQIETERQDFRDTKTNLARLLGSGDVYDLDLVDLEGEDI